MREVSTHGWSLRWLACLLAFLLMPGAGELVENAGHLVFEGHLAHAEGTGDAHEPSGPEHGCTPTAHVCGCHASLAFLSPQGPPLQGLSLARLVDTPPQEMPRPGFLSTIDRPPQV